MNAPTLEATPALGALLGLACGVGMLLVMWRMDARRIRLHERVAPYVRARRTGSGLVRLPDRPHTALTVVERLAAPIVRDASRLLERLGSSAMSIRRRLLLAGSGTSVEAFRVEQVAWAALGLGAGLAVAVALGLARDLSLTPLAMIVMLGAVGGALARDHQLSRKVKERERRMLAEFPTIAELLALAVGAGEAPVAALERLARTTRGELSAEISRTLADVRAGAPLVRALEELGRRTELSAIVRFAEGLAVAVERGSPLAEVLRAQAADARDVGKRELMESGGRREVLMMIPVVFMVLPVTVLFAIFPGLALMRVGF